MGTSGLSNCFETTRKSESDTVVSLRFSLSTTRATFAGSTLGVAEVAVGVAEGKRCWRILGLQVEEPILNFSQDVW